MQATLIENNGNGKVAYDSLILSDPKAFSALNNKISLKIIKSLAESPVSAIDISRRLKIHEQKVYYHMRKLEKAGIIYTISNERRYGMIAKIYSVVSPVISAKLYNKGEELKNAGDVKIPNEVVNFFSPFVASGKLNSKIVIGDPSPHGKYNVGSYEGAHVSDLMIFLGRLVDSFEHPNYKIDTETRESDLKGNLILIGNNKTNSVIDRINLSLPVYFDVEKSAIISKISKQKYTDDRCGIIVKANNPFDESKKILVIGGIRTRGTRAAIISLFKLISNNFLNVKNLENLHHVAQGLDKDSDMVIDDAIILE